MRKTFFFLIFVACVSAISPFRRPAWIQEKSGVDDSWLNTAIDAAGASASVTCPNKVLCCLKGLFGAKLSPEEVKDYVEAQGQGEMNKIEAKLAKYVNNQIEALDEALRTPAKIEEEIKAQKAKAVQAIVDKASEALQKELQLPKLMCDDITKAIFEAALLGISPEGSLENVLKNRLSAVQKQQLNDAIKDKTEAVVKDKLKDVAKAGIENVAEGAAMVVIGLIPFVNVAAAATYGVVKAADSAMAMKRAYDDKKQLTLDIEHMTADAQALMSKGEKVVELLLDCAEHVKDTAQAIETNVKQLISSPAAASSAATPVVDGNQACDAGDAAPATQWEAACSSVSGE